MTLASSNLTVSEKLQFVTQLIVELGLEARVSQHISKGVIAGPDNPDDYIDAVLVEFTTAGVSVKDARVVILMRHVEERVPRLNLTATVRVVADNVKLLAIACKTSVTFIESEAQLPCGLLANIRKYPKFSLTSSMVLSIAHACGVPTYVLTRSYVGYVGWGIFWTELHCRGLTAPTCARFKPLQQRAS